MSGIPEDDAIEWWGHTFEHAYNTDKMLIVKYMLIQTMVVHHDCRPRPNDQYLPAKCLDVL